MRQCIYKEAVHMLDDVFWNMGFRSPDAANKVHCRTDEMLARIRNVQHDCYRHVWNLA